MKLVNVYPRRFRKVRDQHELKICVCCGQGIRQVWTMSNGWTMGPACMRRATVDTPSGERQMMAAAYERIMADPHHTRVAQARSARPGGPRDGYVRPSLPEGHECSSCEEQRKFGLADACFRHEHLLTSRDRARRSTSGMSRRQRAKIHEVMHEHKYGRLKSGSRFGPRVTRREQAIAIAISEARRSTKRAKRRRARKAARR